MEKRPCSREGVHAWKLWFYRNRRDVCWANSEEEKMIFVFPSFPLSLRFSPSLFGENLKERRAWKGQKIKGPQSSKVQRRVLWNSNARLGREKKLKKDVVGTSNWKRKREERGEMQRITLYGTLYFGGNFSFVRLFERLNRLSVRQARYTAGFRRSWLSSLCLLTEWIKFV